MIVTQRKKIPWHWAILMVMPAFGNTFVETMSNVALPYTIKKYNSIPVLITFLGSLSILFSIVVSPYVAWKSDRIWTRFGRRKPFLMVGWFGLAFSLLFVPNAPNLVLLAMCIASFQFFWDLTFLGPYEPLLNEVVPVQQRGRASTIRMGFANLAMLIFSLVLFKKFDHEQVHFTFGRYGALTLPIRGEELIYWFGAASVFIFGLYFLFGVKETPVPAKEPATFSFKNFFGGMFADRQSMKIYLLVFASVALNMSLAQLAPLMITEQFHYTKATFGNISGILIIAKLICVLPIGLLLADRFDRLTLFGFGIACSTIHPLMYWIYIHFFAPAGIPPVKAILIIDGFGALADLIGNISIQPLFFDFVPRHRYGSVYAGVIFVRGLVKMAVVNGVGAWVTIHARIFHLPKKEWDYSSGLLYIFLVGLLACAGVIYFARERRRGRIIEHARIEQPQAPENESAVATLAQ